MKYLVAGNYAKFSVTLTQKSGELITPYIPTEGDVVQISLYGARRFDYPNYEQAQNVLTFEDNGCLNVGLYCLEVKITEANTHKLRCMYREQIRVVASNDDVPTDASFTDDDVQLSGQFDIVASTEIVVDDALSLTSTNPVQNKVVTAALDTKGDALAGGLAALGYEIELKRGNTPLSFLCVPYADAQTDGLMSSSDYTKLAALPTADTLNTTLAGKADEVAFAPYDRGVELYLKSGNDVIYSDAIFNATTDTGGIMSAADKTKLDALPTNSDLQTALNAKGDALASQPTAAGYEVSLMHGNTYLSDIQIPFADAQDGGLISSIDYTKLAGIATGATRVIVDSTFDTTSNNAISNSAVATALGDIDTILDNINGD